MPDICQVKRLAPRLVVYDSQVEPPVVDPAVHPVHKAGDADGDPVHVQLHRGQVLAAAEAQFKGDGLELGGTQLLGHVVHHGVHRLAQAAEQVLESGILMLQSSQLLLYILLHRLIGDGPQLLRRHLLHAPPGLAGFEDVLQHEVDEGAVLRGLKSGSPPWFRLQAVLHEIGEVAGLVLVHPGGRHRHPPAVEQVHRRAGQPSPLPAGG